MCSLTGREEVTQHPGWGRPRAGLPLPLPGQLALCFVLDPALLILASQSSFKPWELGHYLN